MTDSTLEVSLHDGQLEVFNDESRFKILICGRRWGKTTAAAYIVIVHALSIDNGVFFLVSPNYSQTQIIWRMILRIVPRIYIDKIMEGDKYILLRNGTYIFAKSGDNPDSLRGEGLDGVVLDEAAMLKREVWEQAVRPALADKKGWAVFISTPKGKNYLYELFLRGMNDKSSNYKSFHFTSYDNPYLDKDELDEMIQGLPEMEYKQEILAEFIEGGGAVFKNFEEVIEPNALEGPQEGEFYYIGVDLGRLEDFTVISVGKLSEQKIVYLERFNKTSWEFIKSRILDVTRLYNGGTVYLDSTGYGDPIYQDLCTEVNMVGIKFTQQIKWAVINNLALMMENHKIRLPDNEELRREFQAYTFDVKPSGAVSYGAPSGFHDDIVISIALTAYAMNSGCSVIGVIQEEQPDLYDEMEEFYSWGNEDETDFIWGEDQ